MIGSSFSDNPKVEKQNVHYERNISAFPCERYRGDLQLAHVFGCTKKTGNQPSQEIHGFWGAVETSSLRSVGALS